MSLIHNILIDQDKFASASADLVQLANDLTALQSKIDGMLDTLMRGFDTPAGKQFHALCQNGLIEPMGKQRLVLEHVSENLATSKNEYQSVFNAYQELNNSINF